MSCGAALYFDEKTDAAVRGLWQYIEDAGLPSEMLKLNYPPHLSLMLCKDTDLDGLREVLPEFIARHPPIPLNFSALGIFSSTDGVIYLAPTVNRALLDFHAELWSMMERFLVNPDPYYRPGVWVPHITLDINVPKAQLGAVIAALNQMDHYPREGLIRELFLADFPEDEPGAMHEQFKARLGVYL